MLRQTDHSLKLISGLNISTFWIVAITVFLTIWIIIVGHPMVTPGVSLDLPRVGHPTRMPAADRRNAMIVAVMRDGKVFFQKDQVNAMNKLSGRIREQIARGSERKVYIKADARTKYGNVSEVLDAVRDAGISNIAFLVDQRRTLVTE